MPTNHLWLLRALTNLHVGSGNADYGIVDKHVQRDPVTDLPILHASSIKGAFREAFREHPAVTNIFGSENPKSGADDLKQGKYRFYSAKLLALPVRASEDFFYVATCLELLDDLVRDAAAFDIELPGELVANIKKLKAKAPERGKPHRYGGSANAGVRFEDWHSERQTGDSGLEALLGERVALLHAADFKVLSDELPVIARNHLENGISVNLWYEQVVPREARFYCPMYCTDNTLEQDFARLHHNQLQIGGNATVGYGLTRFTKL